MTSLSITDSIIKLQLSFKCHYQLRKAGIYTVGDLLSCDKDQMNAINGLSAKNMEEIYTVLDILSSDLGILSVDTSSEEISRESDVSNDEDYGLFFDDKLNDESIIENRNSIDYNAKKIKITPKKDNALSKQLLYLKYNKKSIDAIGKQTAEGFWVLKGSLIGTIVFESLKPSIRKKRKNANIDEHGVLQEDMFFKSASYAASFVVGSSVNGLKVWKTADNITLKELENSLNKNNFIESINDIDCEKTSNEFEVNVENENNEDLKIKLENLGINSTSNNESINKVLPLESIGLSNRSYNCLKRAGYSNAFQLINITEDELLSIRTLGHNSMVEIINKMKEVIEGKYIESISDGCTSPLQNDGELLSNDTEQKIKHTLLFYNADGTSQDDIPIENLGLSLRSYNSLKKAGYNSTSQLIDMTKYSLLSIKNLGDGSATEILNIIKSLSFEKIQVSFNDGVKQTILNYLKNISHEVDKYKIYTLVQEAVMIELNAIESILCEMEYDKKINIIGDKIELRRITILEYVQSIGDERIKKILSERLHGLTLEEVGKQNGNITRERVRQLEIKYLNRRPILAEDKYIEIFEKYYFTKNDFFNVFEKNEVVYNYLLMVCKIKRADKLLIKQLTTDESVSVDLRRAAEKIVYKDFISINGEHVYKSRGDISNFILKTYFRDEAPFNDFVKQYNKTLEYFGLASDENLTINMRSYKNKLSDSRKVLWRHPETLRYYDIDGYDFTDLLREIELTQYNNVEISAHKLFTEHRELMNRYDIRNGYEMHNLLKKLHEKNEIQKNIVFGRIPIIEFGKVSREKQVFEMLINLAPVSKQDLVTAYEQEYGVAQKTIRANYLECIAKYLDGETYDISIPPLSGEQFARMKDVLTENYYDISEITRIYQREFPSENENNINPFTIKTLGFIIYNSYVIKNNYISVSEYCRTLLTTEDIIDSRTFPLGLTGKGSYNSVLMSLKDQYEIIEYEPLCYINIRRLNNTGITVEHLREYCDAVMQHTETGEYFTISSLNSNGFSHHLDNLGFSTVFYSSLLSEDKRFTYQRMGGTKVFRKGVGETNLRGFLEYIIERETSVDIYDFIELLTNKYGVLLDRHKIISTVNNSSMHYDSIMEKVYIDYYTYFEEV